MEMITLTRPPGPLALTPCAVRRIAAALLGLLLMAGCQRVEEEYAVIRVWSHQGQEQENQAMRQLAAAFNAAHAEEGVQVHLTFFPDHQYTEKISIAAAAGDLPDAFDLDGPTLAQFVDAGLLQPLDAYWSEEERTDFLDTIIAQGTLDGQLYALGAFDSAMVLYVDREWLREAGVPWPEDGTPWHWEEFMAACRRLRDAGRDPVSLHLDVTADEWYTYAFSPVIWSAGGQLIDTETDQVEGVLNHPDNIAAVRAWQALFEEGLAARAPIHPDPFGAGETAMDWNGHWMARSHLARKGDRLGVMPLPRMRELPVRSAPCGSWCWAISAHSARPDDAARWLRWVTDPHHGIPPIVRASGAIPARHSAFQHFPEYEEDPWRLFRQQLSEQGRPRPQTPFYPNLTQHFAAALRDIAQGADAEARLDRAAAAVQRIVDRRRGRESHDPAR